MLLTTGGLKDLMGTVALMAMLSVAYGAVMRAGLRPLFGRSALGALFGLAAILAIYDPVRVFDGLLVDLRNLPIALAGAFLGPQGAAVAAACAVAMRMGIGGTGTLGGCVSIMAAGGLGLLWARLAGDAPRRGAAAILGLAIMTAIPWGTFVLPAEMRWRFVATVWPVLVPLHVLGAVVVGLLLERERGLVEQERRLARAAERDPLTGLLNRRGFEATVARSERAHGGAALLILDLDHFKRVNDTHGHAAGDAILQAVGPRLHRVLRGNDAIGRFGGEEFVVFLPAISARGAEDAAQRLCGVIRGEFFSLPDGGALAVTGSVGGAWTAGPARIEPLLARADAALYAAKRAGRDRCRFAAAPGDRRPDRPGPDRPGLDRPADERADRDLAAGPSRRMPPAADRAA